MLSKNRDIGPPPLILPEVLMKDFGGGSIYCKQTTFSPLAIEW